MAKKESEAKRTRRGDKLEVEVIPRIEDTSGLSQDLKTCIESTNIVFNNWHNTVDRDVRTGNYLTCLKNIDEIKSFKEFFIFFQVYLNFSLYTGIKIEEGEIKSNILNKSLEFISIADEEQLIEATKEIKHALRLGKRSN